MELLYYFFMLSWRTLLGCALLLGIHAVAPHAFEGAALPGIAQFAAAALGLAFIGFGMIRDRSDAVAGRPRKTAAWALGLVGYMGLAWAVLSAVDGRKDGLAYAVALAMGTALGAKLALVRRLFEQPAPMIGGVASAPNNAPAQQDPMAARQIPVARPSKRFADIAGMADLKATLNRAITPFRAYNGKGAEISDTNGVLLSGPPGNGKTLVAEAIAGELGFAFVKVTVGDVTSKFVNQSAGDLRSAFDAAIQAQPAVLFIDEIDAIARSRDAGNAHAEDTKLTNELLTQIDRIRKARVLLVAATNFVDSLDRAVCRDGRFDFRIEVPYPDQEARVGILDELSRRHGIQLQAGTVDTIASRMERRSAAFIEGVVKRVRDDLVRTGRRPATAADFKAADRSASRNASLLAANGPKVSEIHMPEAVKIEAQSLVGRLAHWDETVAQGGTPPKGVLFFGPPGTGKTSLARAIQRELGDWHMIVVKTPEILADPRKFEAVLEKAAQHRPAFVFLDEADELLKDRQYSANASATNTILTAMDGMMGLVPEVVFIAATNSADAIDAAAKRGGRFDEKIYLGNYAGEDLVELLERNIAARPSFEMADGLDARRIAEMLGECAPADAISVVNKAVNYTFSGTGRRAMTVQDVQRAIAQLHAA